jgi:predicted metal-dependent HD superfamily phosphohydrolase
MQEALAFACPTELLERLVARYAEPQRHYHVWSHVEACLRARRELIESPPPEVDLALLFHDAIYEPLAPDNEERSAALLRDEGRTFGLAPDLVERAAALVLATAHREPPTGAAAIVVDADLSILGSEPTVFAAYEQAVRREYAMIDDASYATGRARILRRFMERPTLYATARGRELWEAAARRNLAR